MCNYSVLASSCPLIKANNLFPQWPNAFNYKLKFVVTPSWKFIPYFICPLTLKDLQGSCKRKRLCKTAPKSEFCVEWSQPGALPDPRVNCRRWAGWDFEAFCALFYFKAVNHNIKKAKNWSGNKELGAAGSRKLLKTRKKTSKLSSKKRRKGKVKLGAVEGVGFCRLVIFFPGLLKATLGSFFLKLIPAVFPCHEDVGISVSLVLCPAGYPGRLPVQWNLGSDERGAAQAARWRHLWQEQRGGESWAPLPGGEVAELAVQQGSVRRKKTKLHLWPAAIPCWE